MDRLGMTQARNSNIELLRVISMAGLVVYHFVMLTVNNVLLYYSPYSSLIEFLGCIGKFGLDEFMLISGYFMCSAQPSPKTTARKLLRMWGQIMFYTLGFLLLAALLGLEINRESLKLSLMPVSYSHYWFASYYFVILLVAPYLNLLIRSMKRTEHLLLVGICAMLFIVLPSLLKIYIAYNLLGVMLCMYFTGAYIRLYSVPGKPALYFLLSALSALLGLAMIAAANHLAFSTFNISLFSFYAELQANESFFMYLVAVLMLLAFTKLPERSSRVLNTAGALTFGVYLFHANSFAAALFPQLFDTNQHLYGPGVFAYILGGSALVYLGGSVIELLRMKLAEPVWMKLVDGLLLPASHRLKERIISSAHRREN